MMASIVFLTLKKKKQFLSLMHRTWITLQKICVHCLSLPYIRNNHSQHVYILVNMYVCMCESGCLFIIHCSHCCNFATKVNGSLTSQYGRVPFAFPLFSQAVRRVRLYRDQNYRNRLSDSINIFDRVICSVENTHTHTQCMFDYMSLSSEGRSGDENTRILGKRWFRFSRFFSTLQIISLVSFDEL